MQKQRLHNDLFLNHLKTLVQVSSFQQLSRQRWFQSNSSHLTGLSKSCRQFPADFNLPSRALSMDWHPENTQVRFQGRSSQL